LTATARYTKFLTVPDPVGLASVSSGPAGLWVGDGDGKTVDEISHP
jgi:hypothetical protein